MRTELELIEKIERYLNDQLSPDEKKEFEDQMKTDPGLSEEVRLQQEVMMGIERANLKQKVTNSGRRFTRGRNFTRWGTSGFIVLVIIAAVFYYQKTGSQQLSYKNNGLPEYNEAGEKNWANADRNLEAQVFYLDAAMDTVIETKGGIVLSVPANGFLGKNGQPVKGKFELAIKEALDPASIIRAGLSTRSGDRLLETGGMFFLDARKDGEILTVNPANGIYVEVPTDSVKPGMQLFNGRRMPDSSIDWVNPKPLEHSLVPVDIQSLNFYPPHYLDSLKSWGYDIGKKTFTDSLYYSLASVFETSPQVELKYDYMYRLDSNSYPVTKDISAIKENSSLDTAGASGVINNSEEKIARCGINPAKIKAIWDPHFQNTLISTREFEERISWIHRYANNDILDLYINNLDKNLSYIDSLAAGKIVEERKIPIIRNQFLSFASRYDGKIKNGNKQFDKLREYYQRKATAFAEAMAKTQSDFWNKQAALDKEANIKQSVHQMDSLQRENEIFEEEFSLNLKKAWGQLGYDTTINAQSWDRSFYKVQSYRAVYAVQIASTGWCNVDRYEMESVLNRISLNYSDQKTGKKATINYLPASFQVQESNQFDRLFMYLLPDKLSSFMLVKGSNGKYAEKLNELLKYKLVCVGYKGDQAFIYFNTEIISKDYSGIVLTAIAKNDLDRELNKMANTSQFAAMNTENIFLQFDMQDRKRQKRNKDLLELREKLIKLIFPCYIFDELK